MSTRLARHRAAAEAEPEPAKSESPLAAAPRLMLRKLDVTGHTPCLAVMYEPCDEAHEQLVKIMDKIYVEASRNARDPTKVLLKTEPISATSLALDFGLKTRGRDLIYICKPDLHSLSDELVNYLEKIGNKAGSKVRCMEVDAGSFVLGEDEFIYEQRVSKARRRKDPFTGPTLTQRHPATLIAIEPLLDGPAMRELTSSSNVGEVVPVRSRSLGANESDDMWYVKVKRARQGKLGSKARAVLSQPRKYFTDTAGWFVYVTLKRVSGDPWSYLLPATDLDPVVVLSPAQRQAKREALRQRVRATRARDERAKEELNDLAAGIMAGKPKTAAAVAKVAARAVAASRAMADD